MDLAREHGVVAMRTKLDELADVLARVEGDDVQFDVVEETMLALTRHEVLTSRQFSRLLLNYMREKRRLH